MQLGLATKTARAFERLAVASKRIKGWRDESAMGGMSQQRRSHDWARRSKGIEPWSIHYKAESLLGTVECMPRSRVRARECYEI